MRILLVLSFLITALLPLSIQAQESSLLQDKKVILKARVVEVSIPRTTLPDTLPSNIELQLIKAEILEGEEEGKVVEIENDYLSLKVGETFFISMTERVEDGKVFYAMHDKYRLPALYFFFGFFVLSVLIFGGIQGIRGLVSLIGSVVLIVLVLIPGILGGYSPTLITIGVSSLIIVLGSYITHGFNRTTSSAVVGMIITVIVTGVLAYIAVKWAGLSGFDSEEAVFLNWNTGGSIDLVGILFGGIMIGLLGVLYDVAIGQAVSVEELREAGPHMTKSHILKRALRIGREHTGALVNTLAIAYVGASLPLLLLFYSSNTGALSEVINREIFSTEIIRILIGSIGLVLAVPITTLISVFMLVKEGEVIKKTGHTHHH